MAKLKYIILHCTATPEGRDVSAEDIREWHLRGRGWSRVGYHYLIQLDGTVVPLHPHNSDDRIDPWEITNGVRGQNSRALHIVYAGGCAKKRPSGCKWHPPKDTRTKEQLEAMERLVKELLAEHTSAKVAGHNQFANKACPSFNVPEWAASVDINKLRIL